MGSMGAGRSGFRTIDESDRQDDWFIESTIESVILID